MAKIKLSETIHFHPLTEISIMPSSESKLKINLDSDVISPGNTISAQIHCTFADGSTSDAPQLDYLSISLEGEIWVNENSTPFAHTAEIEHGRRICNPIHFVLPFSIRIPENALTNNTGATWKLSARAVWQNTHITQDQVALHVVLSPQN